MQMGEEDDVEYFQCCEDGELEQAHVSAVVSAHYELAENCLNRMDRTTVGASGQVVPPQEEAREG